MQSELDKYGFITNINRVSNKHFVLLINGEAVKSFKKRQSANLRIQKLYEQTQNTRRTNPPVSK